MGWAAAGITKAASARATKAERMASPKDEERQGLQPGSLRARGDGTLVPRQPLPAI